ncbi:DUF4130 domain-containing protein [Robiginitalea marina]|uniref:DUF4130 domain-containing protein n=1 Tax=Robiginitalea marina TaxID=2954105 RepID=A0ABT1ATZ4_9FLAO|nr:DUF4130 domain-containing protein [Robiginitalea marina]MCO5723468.1 DUF4130 domain-containing protein [Robiginitalea marina]
MEQPALFYYDESFEGFLTACSSALAQPEGLVELRKTTGGPEGLFQNERRIRTDRVAAMDLWHSLGKKGTAFQRLVYFSFLSEREGVERKLLTFIRQVLGRYTEKWTIGNADPPATLARWAGQVACERRRLETSLSFQNPKEGVFAGVIAPEHNVLPLLSRQLRYRFRGNSWMVYDRRRDRVLWAQEGSPLFLERLVHCPAAVRSMVREMHPFPGYSGEHLTPGFPGREASFPMERDGYSSPHPEKPHRAYQEAV